MKSLIFQLIIITIIPKMTLFNFNTDSDLNNWRIVDDVVMGGRSGGNFKLNSDGHGQFYGDVSLKNNGGFSSVRYNFETIIASEYKSFQLRIKGDGKSYQFRVKSSSRQRYSYINTFTTSGNWETITIPFTKMYPSFRGYELNQPNYDGIQMEEIAFLISNKKEESFRLLIDAITLQ